MNLTSAGELDEDEFTQLATKLNDNVKEAAGAIGIETVGNKEVALFSTVAVGLFRQYLQGRARNELRKALAANQEAIETFAAAGEQTVAIAARVLWQEYDERTRAPVHALSSGNGTAAELEQLLALDEEHLARLEALRSLRDTYRRLPAAHQELHTVLGDESASLSSIRELYEEGRRLERLYRRIADVEGGNG